MNINEFIEESIKQIKQGVRSANEKEEYYIAEIPSEITFDISVIKENNEIRMANPDDKDKQITRINLKIPIVCYRGGKSLYGVKGNE